tara:strand:- start:1705 stop:2505 length:801 start_codon:yes stop_codon:yes gene_type:complete
MDFIFKFLIIITVTIIIVLFISYDIYKERELVPIEGFNEFQTTIITGFTPKEGDSSTIVKIKGKGLQYIQEVLFNGVECIILEDRGDNLIKIMPPAMSEVGITIEEVRKSMDEIDSGIQVIVSLQKKGGGTTSETSILLPDVSFTYIDKGKNWKNKCPIVKKEEINQDPPALGPAIITDAIEPDSIFKEGTDLYFLHVTLPAMEEKLTNLINEMNGKIKNQENQMPKGWDDLEKLKKLQAHNSIMEMKEEINNLRYNIHKKMGYSI